MVERRNQQPTDLEKATAFLREGLASHPKTGPIVERLNRIVSFQYALSRAQTPLQILKAVSSYSNQPLEMSVITEVVDVWANGGHNRKRGNVREIIVGDFETWRAER